MRKKNYIQIPLVTKLSEEEQKRIFLAEQQKMELTRHIAQQTLIRPSKSSYQKIAQSIGKYFLAPTAEFVGENLFVRYDDSYESHSRQAPKDMSFKVQQVAARSRSSLQNVCIRAPAKNITLPASSFDLLQLQKQLFAVNPTGFGLGGVSWREVGERFARRHTKPTLIEPARYPFMQYRVQVAKIAQRVFEAKLAWYKQIIVAQEIQRWAPEVDRIWPEPLYDLLVDMGEINRFSIEKYFCYLGKDIMDLKPQLFKLRCQEFAAAQEAKARKELDLVCEKIYFSKSEKCQCVRDYYQKMWQRKVPSALQPQGFQNCQMETRIEQSTTYEDIKRYLEGLQKVLDSKQLQIDQMASKDKFLLFEILVNDATVDLSFEMSKLLEFHFLQPLQNSISNFSSPVKERSQSRQNHLRQTHKSFITGIETSRCQQSHEAALLIKNIQKFCETISQQQFNYKAERVYQDLFKIETVIENGVKKQKIVSNLFQNQIQFYSGKENVKKTEGEKQKKDRISEDSFVKVCLPIIFLCAKIAAVKATEEIYCLVLNGEQGRIAELQFLDLIDQVVDPHGLYTDYIQKSFKMFDL